MAFQFQSMAVNLIIAIVMKAIGQFTTFQYSIFNSNQYHTQNGTCQLKEPEDLVNVVDSPVMEIFHTGYILSAFGGLVSNRWLEYRTVLVFGGALMTLSIDLMGISIWFGLICQTGFYALVWVLYPLYMGLVLPCLFYGFIRWSSSPRSRMVLVVFYYYSAEATSWIKVTILPIIKANLQQHSEVYVAAVGLCLCIIFTGLSMAQKRDSGTCLAAFELPTIKRQTRYFRILTAFTLFAVQLYDGHVFDYQKEILLYSNSSNITQVESNVFLTIANTNVPRLINMAGILSTSVALIFAGACKQIPFASHELRIQIGILLAAGVALSCFLIDLILSRWGPSSPIVTTAIFCTASYLDGVAEIITMVAVYEFVVLMGSRNHKLLLIGIAFSVWSLAYYLRLGIRVGTIGIILPLITSDSNYSYCATHGLDFVLLMVCLIYIRLVSFPLAFTLMQDEEESDTKDEQNSLLSPI